MCARTATILFMRPLKKVLVLALVSTLSEAPAQIAGGPPGGAIEAIVIDPKDPAIRLRRYRLEWDLQKHRQGTSLDRDQHRPDENRRPFSRYRPT